MSHPPTTTTLKAAMATALAWVLALPMIQIVLLVMAGVDWLTGLAAAGYRGEIDSNTGWWGAMRKGVQILVVLLLAWIERSLHLTAAVPEQYAWVAAQLSFSGLLAAWLVVNEAWSICENLHRLGIPLPKVLVTSLRQLRDKMGPAAAPADFDDTEVGDGR